MSEGAFALVALGVPFLVLTAIMLRTLDAPAEAVGTSTWIGGAALGLAALVWLVREARR